MNPEMKQIKRLGTGTWKSQGPITLSVTNLVTAKLEPDPQNPKAESAMFCQITAKVECEQALAFFKEGKLVGGDPDRFVKVAEWVVFERNLDEVGSGWKIAGKIEIK
jgi:hypothetical protein